MYSHKNVVISLLSASYTDLGYKFVSGVIGLLGVLSFCWFLSGVLGLKTFFAVWLGRFCLLLADCRWGLTRYFDVL